jgi:hypothetical protein
MKFERSDENPFFLSLKVDKNAKNFFDDVMKPFLDANEMSFSESAIPEYVTVLLHYEEFNDASLHEDFNLRDINYSLSLAIVSGRSTSGEQAIAVRMKASNQHWYDISWESDRLVITEKAPVPQAYEAALLFYRSAKPPPLTIGT